MSSMTRREALEANGGDGTLLDWTARFGTEEACEADYRQWRRAVDRSRSWIENEV